MADSAADRQRRFRQRRAAHSAGDHSFCDGSRCDALVVTDPVTPTVTDPEPVTRYRTPDLAPGGAALWAELMAAPRTPGEVALIGEACRLKDRADTLDRLIRGDRLEWARLSVRDDDGDDRTYILVIDNALSQARMHATTLRGIVTELRQTSGAGQLPGDERAGRDEPSQPAAGGGDIDDLAAKRARRLANAAGS